MTRTRIQQKISQFQAHWRMTALFSSFIMRYRKGTTMKRSTRILLAAAGLIILALALFNLDFRASQSNARNEHQTIKSTSGDGLPFAMRDRPVLVVSVTGDPALVRALQPRLLTTLRDSGRFREVRLLDDLTLRAEHPYLMVRVMEKDVLWTPVFGRAQVRLQTGFGSNGDMGHVLSEDAVIYSSEDGPGIHSSGDYKLADQSMGLLTYPGYHSQLADNLVSRISEDTVQLFNAVP
jgi:hypothetical protein